VHTPGPWKFERETKTIRSARENYWLATMESWDGAVDHDANAQLIAAAPDLLKACTGALAALSQNKTFPADVEYAIWCLSHAIAKSEGTV
jgi:hypothetical protein